MKLAYEKEGRNMALRFFPWVMKFYAGENLKVSIPSVSNFTLWKNLPTLFNP